MFRIDRWDWAPRLAPWVWCIAAVLGACGGGSSDDGVGVGGTGSAPPTYSSGAIEGFGSIIVNGVRFDDTTAVVVDDEGALRSRDELKLGMQVDIEAGPIATAADGAMTSTAVRVQVGSSIVGPVQAVDVAGSTLVVMGQTVLSDAQTVFEGFNQGLRSVFPGQQVEVHAFHDGQRNVATRVERLSQPPRFKLRGRIDNLDTTARSFTIGGAAISYANVPPDDLPALSNGLRVRVTVNAVPQNGVWMATRVRVLTKAIAEHVDAQVEGLVTDFVSPASFKVNGVAVDASGDGVDFDDGDRADLADGVRVEVEGQMQNGVLVARKVEFEHDDDAEKFELRGAIESADAAAHAFVLHDITVVYDEATRFDGGAASALAAGVRVKVKGHLSADGTRLRATRIGFEQ